MKLYGFPASPNTWKVRAVAAHIGVPVELAFVDLTKGEQRNPDYLALNPTGRTPTLVDGDFVLWESEAIMQYLAGRKPNALWPEDARARADIMRWQSWSLAHWGNDAWQPLVFQHIVKPVFGMGPPDEAAVAAANAAFDREAAVMESLFARQPYLAGDAVTLADFSVAAPLFYADRAKLPIAPYAKVRDWFARVSALPAWRDSAPEMPAAAA